MATGLGVTTVVGKIEGSGQCLSTTETGWSVGTEVHSTHVLCVRQNIVKQEAGSNPFFPLQF